MSIINTQTKVILMWLLVAVGICIHSLMEMSELAYVAQGETAPKPKTIPVMFHIIWITALILPYIFSFISSLTQAKTFKWISLVYAGLLGLLNLFHISEPLSVKPVNISQILLLVTVEVINVILFFYILKWKKNNS